MPKMMADSLPFRSQASEVRSGVRPEGELAPFRERGQEAPGGRDPGPSIGGPDALGTGSNSFPAKVR